MTENTRIHILVVDDDRGILELVRRSLEHEGYQVDTIENSKAVLEQKLEWYQMIILDVMMPGMDGFSLCRELRDRVDCPILFLTAKSEESDLMKGLGLAIVKRFIEAQGGFLELGNSKEIEGAEVTLWVKGEEK